MSSTDPRLRFVQGGDETDQSEILEALGVTIDIRLPDGRPLWRHQVLALALVDLLGRVFTRINVVCDPAAPSDPRLPPGEPLLIERLQAVRNHGLAQPETPNAATISVQVGLDGEPADVYVDGRGWVSYLGQAPSRLEADEGPLVAVGPLVAATRAASQVFQRALAEQLTWTPRLLESSYASALTYQSSEEPLVEPDRPAPANVDALLVGAGSIGGAAVYLFARTPNLAGVLDITDPQTLEDRNPDRAILATRAIALTHGHKADVAAKALAHHSQLVATPYRERIAALVASRPREQTLPLVLSAVDSVDSRREIQDSLPLDVLDAACGPSEISVSGHQTANGPCVYCLHIQDVLAAEAIRKKLLVRATGFSERMVNELVVHNARLENQHLRAIEDHQKLPQGSLSLYKGATLDTLYREALLYGEARVRTSSGAEGAVAAPFTTALAGFLLAGEALKAAAGDAYVQYRLGPWGALSTQYVESPWASPADAFHPNPPRWPTHECLCRNGRRLALIRERYGLESS